MYVLANYGLGNCFICKDDMRAGADNTVATLTTWKGEQVECTVPLCGHCLDGIAKMALRNVKG